jgi:hypothetical protein
LEMHRLPDPAPQAADFCAVNPSEYRESVQFARRPRTERGHIDRAP